MDIKKQKEIIEKATILYYEWMKLTSSTWSTECNEPTDQWRILNPVNDVMKMTIKHLNDIIPPWND